MDLVARLGHDESASERAMAMAMVDRGIDAIVRRSQ